MATAGCPCPKVKEKTLLSLKLGMDLTLVLALSFAIATIDTWYPDVLYLTIVEKTVLPTRFVQISKEKIEIIAGALRIEPSELGKFFNKELTFFFLYGVTILFFDIALFLSHYYRKIRGVVPKHPLPLWMKLFLAVERFLLFVGTPLAFMAFFLVFSALSYNGLYTRVEAFSNELLRQGMIETPLKLSLSLDFARLALYFLISCLFSIAVEYIFYIPAKKRGYSFREHFIYGFYFYHQS